MLQVLSVLERSNLHGNLSVEDCVVHMLELVWHDEATNLYHHVQFPGEIQNQARTASSGIPHLASLSQAARQSFHLIHPLSGPVTHGKSDQKHPELQSCRQINLHGFTACCGVGSWTLKPLRNGRVGCLTYAGMLCFLKAVVMAIATHCALYFVSW